MMSNIEFLYEELRKATDCGSESMTHDDALAQIQYWRNLTALAQPAPYDPIGAWNKGFEEGKRIATEQAQPVQPTPPNAEHCEHGTRWDSVCRSCDELPEPYHPSASHINPDYRDGWNAALAATQSSGVPVGEMPFLANGTRFKIVSDNPFDCKLYGLPKELSGRWVALVAADDDCHLAAARSQPGREPLTVDVFYLDGHDPFICGVYGKLSLGALSEIESDIQENPDFQKGDGVYSYSVTRFEGQYGFEGRCELPPGWELCEIGYAPIEKAHGITKKGAP